MDGATDLMVVISSPLNFFRMVVLPALSRPLRPALGVDDSATTRSRAHRMRMRSSFSLRLIFLRMVSRPIFVGAARRARDTSG